MGTGLTLWWGSRQECGRAAEAMPGEPSLEVHGHSREQTLANNGGTQLLELTSHCPPPLCQQFSMLLVLVQKELQ